MEVFYCMFTAFARTFVLIEEKVEPSLWGILDPPLETI